MNKLVAILFALACFTTSFASGNILGVGMWFWIIIATGGFVAMSQFIPGLEKPGSVLALLLSMISIFAILFGFLAATIGGSFELDSREALLFASFFLVAIFGIALNRTNRAR